MAATNCFESPTAFSVARTTDSSAFGVFCGACHWFEALPQPGGAGLSTIATEKSAAATRQALPSRTSTALARTVSGFHLSTACARAAMSAAIHADLPLGDATTRTRVLIF